MSGDNGWCCLLSVNSSTMKRTLRNNNYALARALELKKAELSSAHQQITNLKIENQSLMLQVTQLQTCANVQSLVDFEHEVKRQVDVSKTINI